MTAVEWLDEQIQERVIAQDVVARKLIIEISMEDYMDIKKQANKMFEQQIIDAYANAVMKENNSDYVGMHEQSSGEIYYAETYGSKGSDEEFDVLKEMFELELPSHKGSDDTLKEYHIVDTNEMVYTEEQVIDFLQLRLMFFGIATTDSENEKWLKQFKKNKL